MYTDVVNVYPAVVNLKDEKELICSVKLESVFLFTLNLVSQTLHVFFCDKVTNKLNIG